MSFKQAEYRISELEDRSFEILNYEEKKKKEGRKVSLRIL